MDKSILNKINLATSFYNQLNNKQRLLILGGTIVFILIIWYLFFMMPIHKQGKIAKIDSLSQLNVKYTQLQNTIKNLENTIATEEVKPQIKTDPKFDALSTLLDSTTTYQSVDAIIQILLKQKDGLQLLSFKTKPILEPSIEDGEKGYSLHRITLSFSGSYFQTLAYIKRFSNPNFPLFFDSLTYVVKSYPKANIDLTLDTITKANDTEGEAK